MILALLGLLGCAEPPPKQPDIVLVIIDTLRADHLGAYGYGRPTSPNIDALASRGTLFWRAYSHAGWTLASFGSLFTGLFPHEHHAVRVPDGAPRFGALAPQLTTLAEALHDAGYATGAVMNSAFMAPEHGLNQGFDLYDTQAVGTLQNRGASATVASGLSWLGTQQKPSFLVLHFMEPHLSYDPPDDVHGTFAARENPPVPVPFQGVGFSRTGPEPDPAVRDYVVSLYDEEVLTADRAVGELVAGLEARHAWGRTLLVVTADHGEEFWDHGGFEHGHSLYGELLRVPLIIAGANAPPKGRVDVPVEHIDLFQGLLARAGAARPEGTHGTDLWTLVGASPQGRLTLAESLAHGGNLVSVADQDDRLVVNMKDRALEAYEIASDGSEREAVEAGQQQVVGRRLFRGLFDLRGGLEPLTAWLPEQAPSDEQTRALQALGYLDDQEAGPTP